MRVLIADDNERVRRGVSQILTAEANHEVCGEAKDGSEAIQKARELHPDLILLDVSMPGLGGLEVTRLLRKESHQAKIIIISQHDPVQLLPVILEAGAQACVDKGRLSVDLLDAIRNVAGVTEARRAASG